MGSGVGVGLLCGITRLGSGVGCRISVRCRSIALRSSLLASSFPTFLLPTLLLASLLFSTLLALLATLLPLCLLGIFKSRCNLSPFAISRLVPDHERPGTILDDFGNEYLINDFLFDAVGAVPLAPAWASQAFILVEEVAADATQRLF